MDQVFSLCFHVHVYTASDQNWMVRRPGNGNYVCISKLQIVIYCECTHRENLGSSLYLAFDHGWWQNSQAWWWLVSIEHLQYLTSSLYTLTSTLYSMHSIWYPPLPQQHMHMVLHTGEASGPAGNSWAIHSWRSHYKTVGKKGTQV